MLASRGLTAIKCISRNNCVSRNVKRTDLMQVRNSGGHFVYRSWPEKHPQPGWALAADLMNGTMWWWIGWNTWHNGYTLIYGHFPYPDSSSWTDEQLGIPPDDA